VRKLLNEQCKKLIGVKLPQRADFPVNLVPCMNIYLKSEPILKLYGCKINLYILEISGQ